MIQNPTDNNSPSRATIRQMPSVKPTPMQPWQVRETVPGFRAARRPRVDPRVEPDDE